MKPMTLISVLVLLILYFCLEYSWYLAGKNGDQPFFLFPGYLGAAVGSFPFCYHQAIRLDAYIYNAAIKLQNFIFVLVIWLFCVRVLRKYAKWMLISFGLCFLEYFITYGDAVYQIPLPLDWLAKLLFDGGHIYFPVSMSPVKFISIAWFSVGVIKQIYDPIYH